MKPFDSIFAAVNKRSPYTLRQICSSLFMITALLWLTVSTPFVYAADQAVKKEVQKSTGNCEDNNPFSNTTEEKNESSVNTLSEYLHEAHLLEQNMTIIVKFYKCHPSNLYFEFHPELISPPPEA